MHLRLYNMASRAHKAVISRTPSSRRARSRALRFYGDLIGPGDLCFDVGANIGNRTEVFLALGARVVAVEPQQVCLHYLEERFGREPRLTVVGKALGHQEGEAEMLISQAHVLSSLSPEWVRSVQSSGRFRAYAWDRAAVVQVTTLDSLISEYGKPIFCKIDVEGYEAHVLAGLSQPLAAVSFEFVPEFIENALSCIDHLDGLGVSRFNYSIGESMRMEQPAWIGAGDARRMLAELPVGTYGDVYARTN
jgi:FkbM family methyltransferase